jgi:hypothetical protein
MAGDVRRSGRARKVAAFAIVGALSCSFARVDELECEEATAHLANCCTGFVIPTTGYCTYFPGSVSCNGSTPEIQTALSEGESRCIRRASCAQIVSTGICARAQARVPTQGGAQAETVCP